MVSPCATKPQGKHGCIAMSACGSMGFTPVTSFWQRFREPKNRGQSLQMNLLPCRRCRQYALRFQVEELFLDSKSGAFEERRFTVALKRRIERLYLIAAIAILYATTQGKPTCRLQAYGSKLTPIGSAVSALLTHRLALANGGSSQRTRTAMIPSLFCPKTRNPSLPRSGLNKISLTRFGSPASVP